MKAQLTEQTRRLLLSYQRSEITDHVIYSRIADREKEPKNRAVLEQIAGDEVEHAATWGKYTGRKVKPRRWAVLWYGLLGWLMGYTFVIKLLENNEYAAGKKYEQLLEEIPEAAKIIEDEQRHEKELAALLDEERLHYVGAIVLGLNDALIELTGAIAGLTFALNSTRLVALSAIIIGVSATLSMASSSYLAERADGNPKALKSSIYTGAAYLVTVVLMVLPYLLYPEASYAAALGTMLVLVILIILFFNYYVSVAKDLPFARHFGEMTGITLGVALISFLIGLAVKTFLGVDI
ncbi:MAG: rubrerythrin family protein [Clostridia bacterium]|nr:rubrerythrin family protein [Clostridia bacterium]